MIYDILEVVVSPLQLVLTRCSNSRAARVAARTQRVLSQFALSSLGRPGELDASASASDFYRFP